jgi:antitoxin MazE
MFPLGRGTGVPPVSLSSAPLAAVSGRGLRAGRPCHVAHLVPHFVSHLVPIRCPACQKTRCETRCETKSFGSLPNFRFCMVSLPYFCPNISIILSSEGWHWRTHYRTMNGILTGGGTANAAPRWPMQSPGRRFGCLTCGPAGYTMLPQCMNDEWRSIVTKTLTKHGNSLALVIDKPILELLNITADTKIEISTDGHALILQPARTDDHKRALKNALEDVNATYGRALKRLAE